MSITTIPEELVDHIATFLNRYDLSNLSLASSQFNHLFAAARWNSVWFAGFGQEHAYKSMSKFITTYRRADGLDKRNAAFIRSVKFCWLRDAFISRDVEESLESKMKDCLAILNTSALRHLAIDLGGLQCSQVEKLANLMASSSPDSLKLDNLRSIHLKEPHRNAIKGQENQWRNVVEMLILALNSQTSRLEAFDVPFFDASSRLTVSAKQRLKRVYASYDWAPNLLIGPAESVRIMSKHHRHLEWLHIQEAMDEHYLEIWRRTDTRGPEVTKKDLKRAVREFIRILNDMPHLRRLEFNLDEATLWDMGTQDSAGCINRLRDSLKGIAERILRMLYEDKANLMAHVQSFDKLSGWPRDRLRD